MSVRWTVALSPGRTNNVCLLTNNRQWAFAASQVTVSKLGVDLCYTNDKTTSSFTPSPITLIDSNINNVMSFLVPSSPFIVDLNDVLLTLSSVFLSPPFFINVRTHLHTLTCNDTLLGPSTALHPTPGGVNLQLQTTSHTSSSFLRTVLLTLNLTQNLAFPQTMTLQKPTRGQTILASFFLG